MTRRTGKHLSLYWNKDLKFKKYPKGDTALLIPEHFNLPSEERLKFSSSTPKKCFSTNTLRDFGACVVSF